MAARSVAVVLLACAIALAFDGSLDEITDLGETNELAYIGAGSADRGELTGREDSDATELGETLLAKAVVVGKAGANDPENCTCDEDELTLIQESVFSSKQQPQANGSSEKPSKKEPVSEEEAGKKSVEAAEQEQASEQSVAGSDEKKQVLVKEEESNDEEKKLLNEAKKKEIQQKLIELRAQKVSDPPGNSKQDVKDRAVFKANRDEITVLEAKLGALRQEGVKAESDVAVDQIKATFSKTLISLEKELGALRNSKVVAQGQLTEVKAKEKVQKIELKRLNKPSKQPATAADKAALKTTQIALEDLLERMKKRTTDLAEIDADLLVKESEVAKVREEMKIVLAKARGPAGVDCTKVCAMRKAEAAANAKLLKELQTADANAKPSGGQRKRDLKKQQAKLIEVQTDLEKEELRKKEAGEQKGSLTNAFAVGVVDNAKAKVAEAMQDVDKAKAAFTESKAATIATETEVKGAEVSVVKAKTKEKQLEVNLANAAELSDEESEKQGDAREAAQDQHEKSIEDASDAAETTHITQTTDVKSAKDAELAVGKQEDVVKAAKNALRSSQVAVRKARHRLGRTQSAHRRATSRLEAAEKNHETREMRAISATASADVNAKNSAATLKEVRTVQTEKVEVKEKIVKGKVAITTLARKNKGKALQAETAAKKITKKFREQRIKAKVARDEAYTARGLAGTTKREAKANDRAAEAKLKIAQAFYKVARRRRRKASKSAVTTAKEKLKAVRKIFDQKAKAHADSKVSYDQAKEAYQETEATTKKAEQEEIEKTQEKDKTQAILDKAQNDESNAKGKLGNAKNDMQRKVEDQEGAVAAAAAEVKYAVKLSVNAKGLKKGLEDRKAIVSGLTSKKGIDQKNLEDDQADEVKSRNRLSADTVSLTKTQRLFAKASDAAVQARKRTAGDRSLIFINMKRLYNGLRQVVTAPGTTKESLTGGIETAKLSIKSVIKKASAEMKKVEAEKKKAKATDKKLKKDCPNRRGESKADCLKWKINKDNLETDIEADLGFSTDYQTEADRTQKGVTADADRLKQKQLDHAAKLKGLQDAQQELASRKAELKLAQKKLAKSRLADSGQANQVQATEKSLKGAEEALKKQRKNQLKTELRTNSESKIKVQVRLARVVKARRKDLVTLREEAQRIERVAKSNEEKTTLARTVLAAHATRMKQSLQNALQHRKNLNQQKGEATTELATATEAAEKAAKAAVSSDDQLGLSAAANMNMAAAKAKLGEVGAQVRTAFAQVRVAQRAWNRAQTQIEKKLLKVEKAKARTQEKTQKASEAVEACKNMDEEKRRKAAGIKGKNVWQKLKDAVKTADAKKKSIQ